MNIWSAVVPGPTRTRAQTRPGVTVAALPAPAATRTRTARPGGTAWHSVAPGGTRQHAIMPPLPIGRERRDVDFAATGTLAVTVAVVPATFPAFTGEGALSVVTLPVYVRAGDLAATGVLSVAAEHRYAVTAALAGEATLTVLAQVPGEIVAVDAALAGAGTLSAAVFPRMGPNPADLAGAGTLSAATLPRHTRTADLAGAGTLSAAVFPSHTRVADYAGAGTLSVISQVVPQRPADFAGEGTLSVVVQVVAQRGADFAGAGTLAVLSFPRHAQAAALAGAGTLSVVVVQKTDWTDSFTRSNGALGANWTTFGLGPDTSIVPEIISNAFRAKTTATNSQSNQSFALATAAAAQCLSDTMAVSAVMTADDNALAMGPIVRASSNGQNWVGAIISSDSALTGIYTRISGTLTRRVTTATTTFASNDTFELRASGNVYTLARNPSGANTTIATWTDTGNVAVVGASNRYGGLYHHSAKDFFNTLTYAPILDDFRVRDL